MARLTHRLPVRLASSLSIRLGQRWAALPLAVAFAPVILAQQPSLYVDVSAPGGALGPPSSSYGAALGLPGVWNNLEFGNGTAGPMTFGPLFDTDGTLTSVTVEADGQLNQQRWVGGDLPATFGDDEALMDDAGSFQGLGTGGGTWTIRGLPAGSYDVLTYALAPDVTTYRSFVSVPGALQPGQVVGGTFAPGFELGRTHAFHTVQVGPNAPLVIQVDPQVDSESLNGFQIVPAGTVPSPRIGENYCAARVNSTGRVGHIYATGSADPAANDVTLTAAGLPVGQFGIFIASLSDQFVPGGSGPGVLCLGGQIARFSGPGQVLQTAPSSYSLRVDLTQIPLGTGTVPVLAGQVWFFQSWHRDTFTFPGSQGSSFTNGLAISF